MEKQIYCPWCGAVCNKQKGVVIKEGVIHIKYVCDRYHEHIFYTNYSEE